MLLLWMQNTRNTIMNIIKNCCERKRTSCMHNLSDSQITYIYMYIVLLYSLTETKIYVYMKTCIFPIYKYKSWDFLWLEMCWMLCVPVHSTRTRLFLYPYSYSKKMVVCLFVCFCFSARFLVTRLISRQLALPFSILFTSIYYSFWFTLSLTDVVIVSCGCCHVYVLLCILTVSILFLLVVCVFFSLCSFFLLCYSPYSLFDVRYFFDRSF